MRSREAERMAVGRRLRAMVRRLDEYTLWAFNPALTITSNRTHGRLPRAS